MSSKTEEKAHAMLNRWVAIKKELNSRSKEKRPKYSTECNNLQDCERWRAQVIKEISKKVADIQNASLGEFRIREMNDEINKLFREKMHWEDRIKELGGPDYKKLAPKTYDAEGYEVPNSGGYKYWGAAKDLPGVRELFAIHVPNPPRKNIIDMYKGIDKEYYGEDDEEEEELERLEKEEEDKIKKEYFNKLEDEDGIPSKKRKINNEDTQVVNQLLEKEISSREFEKFKKLHSGYIDDIVKNEKNLTISKPLTKEELEKDLIEKKKAQILRMLNN